MPAKPTRFKLMAVLSKLPRRPRSPGQAMVLGGGGAAGGGGGTSGAAGEDAGLSYSFDTSTTMGDPGAGDVRFNNGTIASVSELAISDTDDDGNSLDAFLDTLDDSTSGIRGYLVFTSELDEDVTIFVIDDAVTDEGAWHRVPVAYEDGALFASDEPIRVQFYRTGDAGSPGAAATPDYICLRDEKAANTAGGTFTADGTWKKRDVAEFSDTGGNCAVASSVIALATGTYRVRISCPAWYVNSHKARLRRTNNTAATLLVGTSERSGNTGIESAQTRSIIEGRITVDAADTLEIQHRAQSTQATNGFGVAANLGEVEVYTVAEFEKE